MLATLAMLAATAGPAQPPYRTALAAPPARPAYRPTQPAARPGAVRPTCFGLIVWPYFLAVAVR